MIFDQNLELYIIFFLNYNNYYSEYKAKNMINLKNTFKTILFILIFSQYSIAQDVTKLRQDREKLLKEIETINKELDTKRVTREDNLKQLTLLQAEITKREELISIIKSEIRLLNNSIEENQQSINKLEQSINEIKKGYVILIQDAYLKINTQSELLFFLSSKDFSEAYRRYRLLKEYSTYRQSQGKALIESQKKLKTLLLEIQIKRDEKETNLVSLEKENKSLNQAQNQRKQIITEIQKEEKWLRQQVETKKKQEKALENRILEVIRQTQSTKTEYGKDFGDNKGKLSWPLKNGIIINDFGEHSHPVLKGVIIKNNGIDIQSSESDEVIAIFTGEVSRVFSIPGYNNAIIIRHGEYLTVYANLKEIFVKQGQKIKTNEKIGILYIENNDAGGVLHFEIWKENQKLNPNQWLKP